MYGNIRGERPGFGDVTPGPYILIREMDKAVGRMMLRNPEGSDGVVVDVVEAYPVGSVGSRVSHGVTPLFLEK